MTNTQTQSVPLKAYKSSDRITIAAPMPGMEPQDIIVSVSQDGNLTLTGELRGELKGENEVLADEWNAGPYRRTYSINGSVDATRANATYNNGVLVVSLPLSDSLRPATIELERLGPTEGRQEGNSGRSG